MPEKLLILGGTMEAYKLAECLVEQYSPEQLTVISSLAGVTANPKLPAGEVRIGGFTDTYSTGGKPGRNSKLGLQKYLLQEKISLLVNTPHIPMRHKSAKTHVQSQRNLGYRIFV
jgi:precorrin-6A/cobalt-precorrin-6A reductase